MLHSQGFMSEPITVTKKNKYTDWPDLGHTCTMEFEGDQPRLNRGTGETENGSPRENQDAVTDIKRIGDPGNPVVKNHLTTSIAGVTGQGTKIPHAVEWATKKEKERKMDG